MNLNSTVSALSVGCTVVSSSGSENGVDGNLDFCGTCRNVSQLKCMCTHALE